MKILTLILFIFIAIFLSAGLNVAGDGNVDFPQWLALVAAMALGYMIKILDNSLNNNNNTSKEVHGSVH
jgi:uncharacterized membrane protein AbrB (regulator of aidB expression)